ncbi:Non-lysosomal glucosylceramidase [Paragonimus heterotremus]|uniref:Non-lysosomal glucosylceramidase n=1 Tax=Paragonimus heterotremus TaxID=100268 RepID=A0A8J4WY91_9TREM|nr:Non-lysosomal glucosylceramidase [Paragonimus heterotremus]
MGGIGCGAIGRGYRGEFVRSSLIPGMYAYDKQPTDQFILTVRNQDKVLYQQVLSPHNSPSSVPSGLRSWSWGFPAENAHYIGLYPRSWTIYELPQFKLILICQQISPVIPHNYKTTCLPSCVFVWRVLNLGELSLSVSVSFSWYGPDHVPRNTTNSSLVSQSSSTRRQSDSASEYVDGIAASEESLQATNGTDSECLTSYLCRSASFKSDSSSTYGCLLDRMIGNELPCCFGIAAKNNDQVTVSRCPGFLFERHLSLNLIVQTSINTGVSDSLHTTDVRSYQSAPSARMIWDELQSPSGLKDTNTANYFIPNTPSLRRRNPKLAMIISAACTVPAAHPNTGNSSAPGQAQMEFAIVWHSPVVRFRGNGVVYTRSISMLFLCFLIDVYVYAWAGHEYRMFNTVDVHYYSSWALIKLWPKLQLAFNYDCADLTIEEDQTETYFIHRGLYGIRNVESSVPHDFGDPENEPWRDVNAYVMFPTDNWKDLNPKFILQAWRDWRLTRDDHYLLYMLPIVNRVIRICLKAWDLDGDGIIENSGFPDQTFDTWTACGISAYTGGLWIACLYAAHDMLEYALSANSPFGAWLHQSHDDTGTPWTQVKKELLSVLTGAKLAYNRALWTGSYYAYQNTRSGNHDSIMAAQLCGHWFLRATGAPADAILPNNQVLIALKTIQDVNWQSIKKGVAGAVNGALPGSKQDLSNVQAEEFWVGVNYAIASTMVMEGMTEEGLSLAGACYNTVYNRFGLQFQTPEAYLLDGRFRCPGYMRPLAIWSIQQALELTNQHHPSPVILNPVVDEDDDDRLPNPSQRH